MVSKCWIRWMNGWMDGWLEGRWVTKENQSRKDCFYKAIHRTSVASAVGSHPGQVIATSTRAISRPCALSAPPALLGDGAETHPHPTKTSQLCWLHLYLPFPSPVAQMVKNLPAIQETWVQSLGQGDPLEKGMATHSNILAWRISWIEDPGYSPWGRKALDMTEWLTLVIPPPLFHQFQLLRICAVNYFLTGHHNLSVIIFT